MVYRPVQGKEQRERTGGRGRGRGRGRREETAASDQGGESATWGGMILWDGQTDKNRQMIAVTLSLRFAARVNNKFHYENHENYDDEDYDHEDYDDNGSNKDE